MSPPRLRQLWEALRGEEKRTLAGHARAVRGLAFRFDGTRLASVGDDRYLIVWNSANGRSEPYFTGHAGPLRQVGQVKSMGVRKPTGVT